jgi:MFS family permease
MTEGERQYRRLFAAYAMGLLGSGVAVVGLTLLAFDLAEEDAAVVIATALSIKGFAYVVVPPVAAALTGRIRKRPLLAALDLVRAAAILALPFATTPAHVYAAVLVFTAASAAFTPVYQALTPHLLPDAGAYARALAKSRVAVELENAAGPLVAAALLFVLSGRGLFLVAMALFLASAAGLLRGELPGLVAEPGRGLAAQVLRGPRLIATTPGLRGLAPLCLVAAAGTAMVMVNTVGIVQGRFGLDPRAAAAALGVFGLGSVAGALAAPGLVVRLGERATIAAGCAAVAGGLFAGIGVGSYAGLLALWLAIGAGAALAATPAPVALRRLLAPQDHGAAYAALFALGNVALLAAYPAAGWLGAEGQPDWAAFAALGAAAAAAGLATAALWPRGAAPAPAG